MTDLSEWMEAANRTCPLSIERSEWNDPVLSIGGAAWSLSITAPWRVVRGYMILVGALDENASAIVSAWRGEKVTRLRVLPSAPNLDIAATLSNGDELQILCASVHENWVLRAPGELTMAFVPAS